MLVHGALASMAPKSAAWCIIRSALSTLVITIACIVIVKNRKSVSGAVFTLCEDLHPWAIMVATLVATLGSRGGGNGTSLSTPLATLDCDGCSLS
jgi:hypothetical protein